MPATPSWLAAVEAALNRGIDGSTHAQRIARQLAGSTLRVDIHGIAAIRAAVSGTRLSLLMADGAANATLSGTPLALLRLGRGSRQRDTAAAVRVEGDAEIAQQYRQLLAAALPDLEDELARLLGDFPARRLTLTAQRAMQWAARARRTAAQNVSEYLQEESRILVNATEFEEFLRGVDSVREAADRVEIRLQRLEQRLQGSL